MGAMFSSRDARPSVADAARGEDLAFYLQLDLDHEPKDVVELDAATGCREVDAGRGREGALVVSSRGDGGPGAIHAITATHVYKVQTRVYGGGRKHT